MAMKALIQMGRYFPQQVQDYRQKINVCIDAFITFTFPPYCKDL